MACLALSATEKDSLDTDSLKSFPHSTLTADSSIVFEYSGSNFLKPFLYTKRDTALNRFHNYDLFGNDFRPFNTGNIGHAMYDNSIHENSFLDYNSFLGTWKNYLISKENITYRRVFKPFTELNYVFGSQSEQLFNAVHSQNFGDNFNINLGFNKINSQGFYARSKTNHTQFSFSSSFLTKNNRYGFVTHYFNNILDIQENGGISDTTEFQNDLKPIRQSIFVNLDEATSLAQNQIRDQEAFLKQFVFFGQSKTKTVDSAKFEYTDPNYRLTHEITYHTSKKKYTDQNPVSGFYDNVFIDSALTSDSISSGRISNKISFGKVFFSDKGLQKDGELFLKHDFYDYYQNQNIDTSFQNIFAGLEVHRFFGNFEIFAQSDYGISGYNKDDMKFEGKIDYRERHKVDSLSGNSFNSGIELNFSKTEPQLFYQKYYSNHFIWNNNFSKQQLISAKGYFENENLKLRAKIGVNFLNDYIYFDKWARPNQFKGDLIHSYGFVEKEFRLWKFHFLSKIRYQYINEKKILPLPEWLASQAIYFQAFLFDKALKLQVGGEVYYYDRHKAYDYMPATSQFFLQDDFSLGQYPYFDAFVNFKVKRARVFVKYQHLNAGYFGYKYYMIPRYPMPDAAIKFGVNWRLYN